MFLQAWRRSLLRVQEGFVPYSFPSPKLLADTKWNKVKWINSINIPTSNSLVAKRERIRTPREICGSAHTRAHLLERRITQLVFLILIRWIAIYPVVSAIQRSNNRGQLNKPISKFAGVVYSNTVWVLLHSLMAAKLHTRVFILPLFLRFPVLKFLSSLCQVLESYPCICR